MPNWKKVIVSGSNAELNNLVVNNISASGQVGIGTSTPQYDLHIKPSTGNASLMIQSENSFTSELLMHFQGYNNNNEIWKLYGSSAESTAGLSFNTNAFGDVMTLRGNGNVGIGTTSPTRTLDVSGQTRFGQNLGTNDGGWDHIFTVNSGNALAVFKESYASSTDRLVTIGNNDNQGSIFILNGSGTPTFYLRSSAASYINNGYNFGIGTTSPSTQLHVVGTVSSSALDIAGNADINGNISTSGSLYIASPGTIGIGTTSPTATIELITGNIKVGNGFGLIGAGYSNPIIPSNNNYGYAQTFQGYGGQVFLGWNGAAYVPSVRFSALGVVSASKFETEGQISASLFSGSFVGDGSGLTGISAGGGGIFAQTGSYYSTTNNLQITGSLELYKSGSTVFSIEGSQGTLFSVTDSLSGSLFSVNDISGIPIFEVFSDDTVKIGTYNSEAIVVNGSSAIITGSFTGSFVGNGGGLIGIVSSSYAVSSSFASDIPNNLKTYRLELGVSSTEPITTGEKGRKIVPYTGTIIGWKLIADQSTTTTLDVWKRNNSIPDVTYTITGTAKPSLSAATLATSTTLTGWTTSVSPDDVFVLNVDSNDNATYLLLELDILLT